MPRLVDVTQRRLNIIYAVWHQIAYHGLETVTIRQVAAEAKISVGQVQHYFASKEELVLEACREMVQTAEHHYRQNAELEPRAAALRLLTQGLPRHDTSRVAFAVWHSFAARSFADEAIAGLIRESRAGMRQELEKLLVAAKNGNAEAPTPVKAARQLQALADGLALAVFTGDCTVLEAEDTLRRALKEFFES